MGLEFLPNRGHPIMKRMLLLLAPFFALSAGMASADYIQIKINLNRLDFVAPDLLNALQQQMKNPGAGGPPGMPGLPPGAPFPGVPGFPGGRKGGFRPPVPPPPPPPPPPQGGAGPMPPVVVEDPNPRWISVFVEVKFTEDKMGNPVPFAVPIPVNDPNKLKEATVLFAINHKWGKGNWLAISPYLPIKIHRIEREEYFLEFDKKFKSAKLAKEKSFKTFIHLANQALAHADPRSITKR